MPGFAQESQDDTAIDSVLIEMLDEDPDLYDLFDGNTQLHFLYFGSSFSSSTFYVGREMGIDQENVSGQLYYFITNGLYFGVSGTWYSQIDPGFRTTIFTAGFTKALKNLDFLRYRINYDRYVYVNENFADTVYEPDFNSDINLGFTIRNKWIGTRIDYTFFNGKKYDNRINADIFAKIKLFQIGKYDRIQLEPEISFQWGTEEVFYDTNAGVDNSFVEPNFVPKTEFGLMDTELALPISISYNNFDLEFGYHYHIPRSLDPVYYYQEKGYFRVALAYFISIN